MELKQALTKIVIDNVSEESEWKYTGRRSWAMESEQEKRIGSRNLLFHLKIDKKPDGILYDKYFFDLDVKGESEKERFRYEIAEACDRRSVPFTILDKKAYDESIEYLLTLEGEITDVQDREFLAEIEQDLVEYAFPSEPMEMPQKKK